MGNNVPMTRENYLKVAKAIRLASQNAVHSIEIQGRPDGLMIEVQRMLGNCGLSRKHILAVLEGRATIVGN